MLYILALLIGVIAGLRAMTAPAAVAWGAYLGWLPVAGTWASFMSHWAAVGIFTILAIVELDEGVRLPTTLVGVDPDVVEKGSKKANRLLETAGLVNKGIGVINSPAGKLAITIGTGIAAKRIASQSGVSEAFVERLREGI